MPIDRAKITQVSQEKVLNLISELNSKASDENPVFESPPTLPAEGIVFPDGIQRGEGTPSRTRIVQQVSSCSLTSLTDRDSLIEIKNDLPVTFTIPADAVLDFPIGTSLDILQTGVGQVTITSSTITTATYSSGGATGATSLSLSAENLNVEPGQLISGTGIYVGTLVLGVTGATITVDTPFESQVSGQLTFKVGIVATPSLKLRAKWSSATIFKKAKNSWVAFGDLALTTAGIPSTPPAPTVRSVAENTNDFVTIIASFSDNGSAITSYEWESSDGKSGTRSSPGEFPVAQEAGTSQTYRVRAVNGVGPSAWSLNSPSVTTSTTTPTFSFAPTAPPPPPPSTWYCSYSGTDGRARTIQSSDLTDTSGCDYAVVCSTSGYPEYPGYNGCTPPPPPPCSGSFYCGQTTRCCSQARLNAGTCNCTDQCNSCGTFIGCECT
jgi:hypothetical protein